jgi:(1->4)-alpha-D-glucan 1-alpha-D-glucosylmutase
MDGTQDLAGLARSLLETREDGRIKLYLTRQALAFRHMRALLFETGAYRPLEAQGPLAEHICAFARVANGAAALTVVPRHLARRRIDEPPLGPQYWGTTWLPIPDDLATRFRNVLTGEILDVGLAAERRGLELGRVLANFPVALLEAAP